MFGGPPWGFVPPPKPGVIPLRPLSFGDVFSGVFGTLRRYFLPLYVPLLVPALGTAVLLGVLGGFAYGPVRSILDQAQDNDAFSPSNGQVLTLVGFSLGAVALALVGSIVCFVVSSTTATTVLQHAVLGRRVTTRQIWAESRPVLWRVTLAGWTLWGGAVVVLGLSLVPALVLGIALHSGPAAGLTLLLFLPACGLVLYASVRLVLTIPAVVLENQRPFSALRRSWRLNEGAWWRSLGFPYLINLVASFVAQIAFSPFLLVGMVPLFNAASKNADHPLGADDPNTLSMIHAVMTLYLVMGIGSGIVAVLTMPLTPLANGLLYIDRRIRRESLDLALAEHAGVDMQRGWWGRPGAPIPPSEPAPPSPPPAGTPATPSAERGEPREPAEPVTPSDAAGHEAEDDGTLG